MHVHHHDAERTETPPVRARENRDTTTHPDSSEVNPSVGTADSDLLDREKSDTRDEDLPGIFRGPVGRRPVIRVGGALAVSAVAGCLGGSDGAAPDPVALTGGQACDVCGMVIENHPGPNGEIYFRDNAPEGHDNPAWFDSLKQCLFPYLFQQRELGWSEEAIFVTDYSSVEYTVQSSGGKLFISSHPEAEAFASAGDLSYVVGSDVEGAMGPDFVPFSSASDAQGFADENGGEVLSFSEIDEGVVGR